MENQNGSLKNNQMPRRNFVRKAAKALVSVWSTPYLFTLIVNQLLSERSEAQMPIGMWRPPGSGTPDPSGVTYDAGASGSVVGGTAATATISSTGGNVLLIAMTGKTNLYADSVTSPGLTWVNMNTTFPPLYGVFVAFSSARLINHVVTANFPAGDCCVSVAAFRGTERSGSPLAALGHQETGTSGGVSAIASITTTRAQSLATFTGSLRSSAQVVTAGASQIVATQINVGTTASSYVIYRNARTPAAQTAVSMSSTWPLTDTGGLAASVEVLGPLPVLTAPTVDFVHTGDNGAGENFFLVETASGRSV